jgi:flagella basal body P-ring formation protein FlgA
MVLAIVCASVAHAQSATPAQSARAARAARDLPRGTMLTATDIRWTKVDSTAPATEVAPGWVTRRTFREGELLRAPGVSRPDLVASGDAVDVVYARDGVTIKLQGTAVGNGAQGDAVYVKLTNRKRLRGVVAGPQFVKVL